jgi:hypothetical protein
MSRNEEGRKPRDYITQMVFLGKVLRQAERKQVRDHLNSQSMLDIQGFAIRCKKIRHMYLNNCAQQGLFYTAKYDRPISNQPPLALNPDALQLEDLECEL